MKDALHFDYFVIGTGPAGQSLTEAAAKAGYSVGTCDPQPFGGTCSLRGCDPKKVIYGVAKVMNDARRLVGKGIADMPTFDWDQVQAWKRTFTEPVPPGTHEKFDKLGVTGLPGGARFTGPGALMIGDDQAVTADNVIIATGATPAPLDIPGNELMQTSDDFLELDALPESIIIVGGGYIGCNFAHMANALGCAVTVIAADENPVSKFDDDLNSLMAKAARERGMTLHFSSKAKRVEKSADGQLTVMAEQDNGETFTVSAAAVFHCAGRVPNVKSLALDKAGLKTGDNGGIAVDKQLCTCVPAHYAVGDCNDAGLALTPVANHEAKILAENLFEGKDRAIDFYPIPTVAFTLPPIAAVGMTHQQAKDSGKNIRVNYKETTEDFHTRHTNGLVSGHKILIDADTETILGAHLYGPDAQEVINLFALAIYENTTTDTLRERLWAYPTAGGHIGTMVGK